jgi:hypothetical protein
MVYKILVVGSGGHAVNHWRGQINIHESFKVTGVVDTDTTVLERAPELWGVEEDAVATTIDEAMLTGIKADIALICTPIESHHALCIEAMRNNLHVMCEKNMAHSMQAGIEMTRCALEHPHLATVVGHQYPYWRDVNWAIRKAIGTGQLGNLDSITCIFNNGGYWNPVVPTRNGWRRFLDHDYLEDWAVHTIDLFRYFTAMDAIVVSADLWRPAWSKRYGGSSINIRMQMAPPSEYEGDQPLMNSTETDRARRLWTNGKTSNMEELRRGKQLNWKESDLRPYPIDLECGPAAQWKGNNTEDEFTNNVFILEEMKQCIESGGTIKPLRCFENCIKTFTISMAAFESSKRGGQPIFLPDMWEIPRK